MALNAKRMLVFAAVALAGFIVWPALVAAAPPVHTVRVGVLGMYAPSFDPTTDPLIREFIDGLRELGYTPGRDIVFEYKSAQGNVEALPQLAEEVVQSRVDILLTPNTSLTPPK
jgi:putative tryptophan/tyrosine transport system substrate-binding protein